MTTNKEWFAVDRKGLGQLLERRGKSFALLELVSNSWDQRSTEVAVTLTPTGTRAKYELIVEDDDPDGFADLTHAFTLFAPSTKKGMAEKRGRFNLGEKLVLAICDIASILSTTGGVRFDAKGRHSVAERRAKGSEFRAILHLTKADYEEACQVITTLIPPVKTTFNGTEIAFRDPLHEFKATLATEISDEEGNLKPSQRKSVVRLFEPHPGETAMIYEMGIPVVENSDRWHYDVCVSPSTKILTSDLRYVPASSITPGMNLVGFDEERTPHRRKIRNAEVKDVWRLEKPCYRLTFDDGTSVVCSENHQWLTLRHSSIEGRGRTSRWLETRNMRVPTNDRPGSIVVKPFDTWETGDSAATGYLAAAFDGEGCLVQTLNTNPDGVRNVLEFTQVENAMLDKVRSLLDQSGIDYRESRTENEGTDWQPVVHLQISGRPDIVRLLGTVRPERLLPKFNPDGLGTLPTARGVRLIRKEFLGTRQVVAIETSTHTFIAEGLASHNCQKVPLNMDRDNVKPAYLRHLRTLVLNEMHDKISTEDANSVWVKEALGDARIDEDAVRSVVTARFGEKVVAFDPSDQEANNKAVSMGYTVVHGRSLSRDEWENVRKAAAILPAGRVTPSESRLFQEQLAANEAGGEKAEVPVDKWTAGQIAVACYAKTLGKHLLGFEPHVGIVSDSTLNVLAFYGSGKVTFNVGTLGQSWFNNPNQGRVDALLIHEYAHHRASNHLDHAFHDECCRLGAAMRGFHEVVEIRSKEAT